MDQNKKYKPSTIIHKGSDKPKAAKERHYVDNDKFYAALKERTAQMAALPEGAPKVQISEYIGECILKISEGLSNKSNFFMYTYKDEMIGDAVAHCMRYIDSFNPETSTNPFSYFTQACYYNFIGRIAKEGKQTYIKYRATMTTLQEGELAAVSDPELQEYIKNSSIDLSSMDSYISEYDRKAKERKDNTDTKRKANRKLSAITAKRKKSDGPECVDIFENDDGE